MKLTKKVLNPFTQEIISDVPIAVVEECSQIINRAQKAGRVMARLSLYERENILTKASQEVLSLKDQLAKTITSESGKPILQAQKEVERCAYTLKLSSQAVVKDLGEIIPFSAYPQAQDRFGYYERYPLGIIFAITPFNDPLNLVAHKLGPAIAGGNSIILKPSEETPLSALALTDILYRSGLPQYGIQTIVATHSLIQRLLQDESIRMFSFTGGETTAKRLVKHAGLKKLMMELGGNAPVIIMPDVEIKKAVPACIQGALSANGQNCISTQRVILHHTIASKFIEQSLEIMSQYRVGDPSDENTDIGPLIHTQAQKRFMNLYNKALKKGSQNILSPQVIGPTISPCALFHKSISLFDEEEAFGPLLEFSSFKNIDEAIAKANRPRSMIAAGIFSNDLTTVNYISRKIQASVVMINDSSDYRMDAMPFGGFKYGSLGREGVRFALREMTQTKTFCYYWGNNVLS